MMNLLNLTEAPLCKDCKDLSHLGEQEVGVE